MNVRTFLFIICSLLIALPSVGQAQGYAGLGSKADQAFAKVTPGKILTFPSDHGPHRDYRIEWWYVTANLVDQDGAPLGLQWTLFRNALQPEDTKVEGWQSKQFWLGHSAVTTKDTHLSAEIFARGGVGQAGVSSAPFKAWIDDWKMQSKSDPSADPLSHLTLQANTDSFSYAIEMTAPAPLVRHGIKGFSQKSSSGQASYYYSQPFYDITGTVTIDGVQKQVTGKAWLDREWSSQPLGEDQTGWDWFSLHLKDGSKVMLFRLRNKDGPSYASGSYIAADGSLSQINPGEVTFTPLTHHKVADRDIPTSWQISLEKYGLTLTTHALNPQSWMENSFGYWEGPITVEGDAEGVGYLEMTGY